MPEYIKKRDGRLVPYDEAKIASAIDRAFVAAESGKGEDEADRLSKIVTREMNAKENNETPSVEDIQDQVERVLIAEGYAKRHEGITSSTARSAAAPARRKTRNHAHSGGYHVQGRLRIRCEAREREH